MIQAPPRPASDRRSRWRLPAAGLAIVAIAGLGVWRSHVSPLSAPPMKLPAIPVVAASVTRATVPLDLSVPGTVVPYASVAVRALIAGELRSVGFAQGRSVTTGQLLFQIDPRPYEATLSGALAIEAKDRAQLGQLEAKLSGDRAQGDNASKEARRYSALLARHYVSSEQAQQFEVSAQAAQETVAADKAALQAARAAIAADGSAIETARLNLSYTRITSPLAGVAGNLLVDPGNLVKANDSNPLVTIDQIQPLYVSFSLTQGQFVALRQVASKGRIGVQALPAAAPAAPPEDGSFAFTDNTIDPTTGTIGARAVFANADRFLWPGSDVKVKIHLADESDRVVAPMAAIQTGQDGQYVYVIKPDRTVTSRPVTVARTQGGLAVIASGLAAGERVVTDGQLQLTDGARITTAEGRK